MSASAAAAWVAWTEDVVRQLAAANLLQPLVTVVGSILAALIAVVAVVTNRWSTRMKATLDILERLETLDYYQVRYRAFRKIRLEPGGIERMARLRPGPEQSERDLCLDYLNQFEFIALGIEKNILDEGFFRKTYGPTAIREWTAARPLIFDVSRTNPDYLRAFTRLVKRWDPGLRWPAP